MVVVKFRESSLLDRTKFRSASLPGQRVIVEQVSSVDVKAGDKLAEALESIRDGDTLVVTKLGHSVAHLIMGQRS